MKSIRIFLVTLSLSLLLGGCLYTDIEIPQDTDLNQTVLGAKQGEASTYSVLWLFAWGNGGTKAAAENGDLTTINHMDRKIFNILFGLYSRTTTVVYGD